MAVLRTKSRVLALSSLIMVLQSFTTSAEPLNTGKLMGEMKTLLERTNNKKARDTVSPAATTNDGGQELTSGLENLNADKTGISEIAPYDLKGLSLGMSIEVAKQKAGGNCKDATPSEGKALQYFILDCEYTHLTLAEKPLLSQTLYFVGNRLQRVVGVVFLTKDERRRTGQPMVDDGDLASLYKNFSQVLSTKYGEPLALKERIKVDVNSLTPFGDVLNIWKNAQTQDVLLIAPSHNDTSYGKDYFLLVELTSKDSVDKLVAVNNASEQQKAESQRKKEVEEINRKSKDL